MPIFPRPLQALHTSQLWFPILLFTLEESGLGAVDLAATKRRGPCGLYVYYSLKDKVRIGKYAIENGNIKAIGHFKKEFPTLKESIVCNFKKAFN